MEVVRGYKTELNLNNQQITACKKAAGAARWAYNWGLARKQEGAKARKAASDPTSVPVPDAVDLHKELVLLKHSTHSWLEESSKCAPQQALRNLDIAFTRFFNHQAKYPQPKKKSRGLGSFMLEGTMHAGPDWIQLPTFGKVRLFEHGYIPQDTGAEATVLRKAPTYLPRSDGKKLTAADRKSQRAMWPVGTREYTKVVVSEQAGHWFVSVSVREQVAETEQATGEAIGIDLGIKALAVCSNGFTAPNPKALRGRLKALKRLSRHLSKKKKGSKNRAKARKKLARLHKRIADIRKNALHQATATIVAKTKPPTERPRAIVLESLQISGMMKNHHLAQAIADVGMYAFKRHLLDTCEKNGIALYEADPFYPSTQLCSGCHLRPKENIG